MICQNIRSKAKVSLDVSDNENSLVRANVQKEKIHSSKMVFTWQPRQYTTMKSIYTRRPSSSSSSFDGGRERESQDEDSDRWASDALTSSELATHYTVHLRSRRLYIYLPQSFKVFLSYPLSSSFANKTHGAGAAAANCWLKKKERKQKKRREKGWQLECNPLNASVTICFEGHEVMEYSITKLFPLTFISFYAAQQQQQGADALRWSGCCWCCELLPSRALDFTSVGQVMAQHVPLYRTVPWRGVPCPCAHDWNDGANRASDRGRQLRLVMCFLLVLWLLFFPPSLPPLHHHHDHSYILQLQRVL